MKKIFSLLAGGIALVSLASSCADSAYDDKYADPSQTTTVGVPQVFTAVMFKGNTWMNPIYYRHWVQQPPQVCSPELSVQPIRVLAIWVPVKDVTMIVGKNFTIC